MQKKTYVIRGKNQQVSIKQICFLPQIFYYIEYILNTY